MIRATTELDAPAIAAIYNYYIANTVITFEETAVSEKDITERLHKVKSFDLPWLVAEENGAVIGYAYSTRWQVRSAYRHTVEASVYFAKDSVGKGWGTKLYTEIFKILRRTSVHVVIGGITLPNVASVALHEKFGMKPVAHFKQVGYKFDQWLDVGYWQVEL